MCFFLQSHVLPCRMMNHIPNGCGLFITCHPLKNLTLEKRNSLGRRGGRGILSYSNEGRLDKRRGSRRSLGIHEYFCLQRLQALSSCSLTFLCKLFHELLDSISVLVPRYTTMKVPNCKGSLVSDVSLDYLQAVTILATF